MISLNYRTVIVWAVGILAMVWQQSAWCVDDLPYYLKDRGRGVSTSLFGTYIEKDQLLVYPFYEYEKRNEEEYHGSELGYTGETDYIGKSAGEEFLIFLAYGITEDVAVELESALYSKAWLEKAPEDTTSGLPSRLEESGWGDTQITLNWRLRKETEKQAEIYTSYEIDFPLQKNKVLIGTQDWEFDAVIGAVKGYTWGTLKPRISFMYDGAENMFGVGEYALEYLKKTSDTWRWVTTLEGEDDELSAIFEAQWHISKSTYWKFNSGFGLTPSAPDIAPEIGIMLSY